MDNEYKISLGVEIDTKDIQSQINSKKLDPIKLEVDIDTTKLAKKIETGLKASMSGSKTALTLDTASVEKSLGEVSATIKEIRSSIGTLDNKSGMKPLLSSINQISAALEKASNQFESLNANLNALSGKDLSLNLGINLGGSNSVARQSIYGQKVRNETLPELKRQAAALENYLKEYYKVQQGFQGVLKLAAPNKTGANSFNGKDDFVQYNKILEAYNDTTNADSLVKQMNAYKQYINTIKEAANLKGVDIGHITSQFSKSADELIKDAIDVQTGAKEMDESFEKLKQVFGGGNNLNIEGISTQLDSIVADLGEIKTAIQSLSSGTSFDGLTQSFDRLSETIELLLQKCTNAQTVINNSIGGLNKTAGQAADGSGLQKAENELKKIKDLAHQIGQLDFKIVKSDYNGEINQVREFERQLELLKTQYNETLNSLNGKDINIGSEITKEFTEARNKIAEFEAKVADTKAELAKDIKSNIGTNIAKNIKNVHSDFDKLSNKTIDLQQKLDLLDSIKVDLDTAAANNDIDGLIAANERYEKVLKDIKVQLDVNKRAEQDANSKDSLTTAKENALLRLKNLFGDNSEAARKFGAEVERLQREINECGNISGIHKLNKDITNLGLKVKEAGVQTQTFGQKLKKQFSQYSSYLSVASMFMYAEQGLRDMFEQVVAIDTAMTELKKVTDETNASYNQFLSNAASRSKELGTTIDGLVTSTADFARLGYGFEDAQGLAEVANIYAVVGDEIEGVEGATKSLISTLAAFKDEMNGMSDSDFALSIVDKFNEVSNNFAISSGGIGEALQRSASSMAAANNTLDESIALITAANTVVNLCHAA